MFSILRRKWNLYEVIFDIPTVKKEIEKISHDLTLVEIWSSPQKTNELLKKKAKLSDLVSHFENISDKLIYLEESISILEEESGDLFIKDIQNEINILKKEIDSLEIEYLLSGEMDKNNAILSIHPGAGGVESQDWAQMLLRMYLKWSEIHGFKITIAEIQPGEEAGIKSATISISGLHAYGLLKAEAGVHRLVRISPFDAGKRRHTSFAAVLVYPEVEDNIDILIKDDDIKIDTFRASGAGGQHVNKTSSAVRITHIPTGIIVSCQNERSQHKNKAIALKILKSRLYDIKLKEKEKKMEVFIGDKKGISWGSQIRSYILQPYRIVKDHRTNYETSNVDSVLDGNIDEFIKAFLKKK
ncbi:MAG: peptide chain release factor 2 [Nitrospirae bacterium]|nr:peptide chain release factor 2 [Nitrospirota bacterium]